MNRLVAGTNLAADLDAVAVGQAHVDDGDVGLDRRDPRHAFLGGSGLADHLDVVVRLEQLAHAAANDLVIVEQEDANRHGCEASSGNDDERPVEMMRQVMARAAQQHLLEAAEPATADDHEVGLLAMRGLDNHVGGVAIDHLGLERHVCILELVAPLLSKHLSNAARGRRPRTQERRTRPA